MPLAPTNASRTKTPVSSNTAEKSPRLRRGRYPKIHYDAFDLERSVPDHSLSGDERSEFERDRSRIVHSASFRRLQGKTQVFAVGEGAFYRTRLTHSLEMAQVGKGLALRLGADPDLVETVCFVHDIGHPPFGHAGEAEINRLMSSYGGFEANAQNLRILTRLEQKSTKYQGLNLTRASIDGQMKYKNAYLPGARKFYYPDDQDTVLWASDGAFPNSDSQSFECQIMDWADDIAYAVHDLEDSIHAGLVTADTLSNGQIILDVLDMAFRKLSGIIPSLTADQIQNCWVDLSDDLRPRLDGFLLPLSSYQERKQYRKMLTSELIGRYIRSAVRLERPGAHGKVKSERYLYEVRVLPQSRIEVTLLNCLIFRAVMQSPQVMTLEAKACQLIQDLFGRHMKDDTYYLLPDDWRELTSPQHIPEARIVADYLSGMTDDYAGKLHSRLFLPDHGTVFERM